MTKLSTNSIKAGEKIRLRDDVLPLVERRSWVFVGMGEGDRILLGHSGIGYIWETKPDYIDWENYKKETTPNESSTPAF